MSSNDAQLIDVVACCDDAYVQHCAVMLRSLFHNNPRHSFRVFILNRGLSTASRHRLEQSLAEYRHSLEFVDVDDELLRTCKVTGHASIANYYRFLIPHALDPSVQRVLYLDCDLIVRKDIAELWQVDLKDHYVGAVEVWECEQDPRLLPRDAAYFCSGVMMLNLERWRRDDVTSALLQYASENDEKIKWWDQDVLNAVLQGQWLPLHPTWDVNFLTKPRNHPSLVFSIEKSEYLSTITDPAIYHFAGGRKPWHYLYVGPFSNEYFRYLDRTSWAGFRPADVSMGDVLKKFIMKTLQTLKMYEPSIGPGLRPMRLFRTTHPFVRRK